MTFAGLSTTQMRVASRRSFLADRQRGRVGEVEADLAEAILSLTLADRLLPSEAASSAEARRM